MEPICNSREVWNMANGDTSWCGSNEHVRPGASRREFLYDGLLGGLGLTLCAYCQARGLGAQLAIPGPTVGLKPGPDKAVLHIFMPGGISSHDWFAHKP